MPASLITALELRHLLLSHVSIFYTETATITIFIQVATYVACMQCFFFFLETNLGGEMEKSLDLFWGAGINLIT